MGREWEILRNDDESCGAKVIWNKKAQGEKKS